jgi:hypothetical protein
VYVGAGSMPCGGGVMSSRIGRGQIRATRVAGGAGSLAQVVCIEALGSAGTAPLSRQRWQRDGRRRCRGGSDVCQCFAQDLALWNMAASKMSCRPADS